MSLVTGSDACIPAAAPADRERLEKIHTIASYVARNGPDFENIVRLRETNNTSFNFLNGGEHSLYYKWILFCFRRGYSTDIIGKIAASFGKRIAECWPGSIELTPEDSTQLTGLLRENTGSKDGIKNIREWVLDRCHSLIAIGVCFRQFVLTCESDCGQEEKLQSFTRILHTIFVINDVFFYATNVTTKGVYTSVVAEHESVDVARCLWPQLPALFHCAYNCCAVEADRDKIRKIITLWENKHFLDKSMCDGIRSKMILPWNTTIEAPVPYLTSPYPTELHQIAGSLSCSDTDLGAVEAALSIHQLQVGPMVNIARANLRASRQPYSPLDTNVASLSVSASFVEPSRLDARVTEYFKMLECFLHDAMQH